MEESGFDYPGNRVQPQIHNTCRSVMALDVKVVLDIFVTTVVSMYSGGVASVNTWTLEENHMTF